MYGVQKDFLLNLWSTIGFPNEFVMYNKIFYNKRLYNKIRKKREEIRNPRTLEPPPKTSNTPDLLLLSVPA